MEIRRWYNNNICTGEKQKNEIKKKQQPKKNLIYNSKRSGCDYIFNDWKQVSILLLMSEHIN